MILVIIRKEKVKRNNLRSHRVKDAEIEEIENNEQSKFKKEISKESVIGSNLKEHFELREEIWTR